MARFRSIFRKAIKSTIHKAVRLLEEVVKAEGQKVGKDMCGAIMTLNIEGNPDSWLCTRPYGHKGPHIATIWNPVTLCALWFNRLDASKRAEREAGED